MINSNKIFALFVAVVAVTSGVPADKEAAQGDYGGTGGTSGGMGGMGGGLSSLSKMMPGAGGTGTSGGMGGMPDFSKMMSGMGGAGGGFPGMSGGFSSLSKMMPGAGGSPGTVHAPVAGSAAVPQTGYTSDTPSYFRHSYPRTYPRQPYHPTQVNTIVRTSISQHTEMVLSTSAMLRRRAGLLKAQQRRRFSQQQQSNGNGSGSGNIFAGSWKIPATMGFALIGFLQWQHLNHPTDEERKMHSAAALQRLPGSHTAFENTMATERQLQSLKLFPYRAASRLWGQVHDKELPLWLREPVYKAWTAVFDCKLDEMKYPLQDYANLGEFFSRPLKEGMRPFVTLPGHLASPVDGTVASTGVVNDSSDVPTLEQIKGARYRLDEFLGGLPSFFTKKPAASKGKKMYHCVLYLAPGDYHRIHAPVDWKVEERRHFPGNLFPVNQTAAHLIPSLFVENERVALLGEWEHGFFSLTAVGATNVGSIVLTKEPEFRTNTAAQDPLMGRCISKNYGAKVDTTRGEEMAQFKLGSTVVLVFEAPESFQFTIKPGDKLILGKSIGQVAK